MEQDRDFLVMDFEFTVFDTPYGRPRGFFPEIIEAGAVLVNSERTELTKVYQSFVKPRLFPRISEDCKNIAMLSQEDVDSGVDLEEALKRLCEYYTPGRTWLIAWGDADWEVIRNNCEKYKLTCPMVHEDYVDLAQEYKRFFGKERRITLQHAVEERGVEREGYYHLALDDAYNTAALLVKMWECGWRPGA